MTGRKAAVAALLLAAAGTGLAQDAEAPQAAPAEAPPAPAPTASAPSTSTPAAPPPSRPSDSLPDRPAPARPAPREPAAPVTGTGREAAPTTPAAPAASAPQARRPASPTGRTAVIAVLDKRMGTTADFTLNPGQRFTFGRLSGVLQTCERTQPHERRQSGAFVQVIEQPPTRADRAAPKPNLVFSGWLFAESPSLNPFIHPVYDVWLKSCTMRFPDGPPVPSASSRGKTKPVGAKPAGAAPATPAAAPPSSRPDGGANGAG